jgi:uncharacterized PurR-regulated membrane protein YhhQ (DUF165 family)
VSRRRVVIGSVAACAFIGCVILANWLVENVGTVRFPGGPHVIDFGPWDAPSGVLAIGLAFTLRDITQQTLGRLAVVAAVVIGAGLSYLIAPSLAFASGAAFLVSELADFAVYTPLQRRRFYLAVALSGVVGAVVDTLLFLELAFDSIRFWQGQVAGKLLMIALALLLLIPVRRALLPRYSQAPLAQAH